STLARVGLDHGFAISPLETTEDKRGLVVLFATNEALCDRQIFDNFTTWSLRPEGNDDFYYMPVLTIGAEDFLNLYTEKKSVQRNGRHSRFIKRIGFDARIKFLDASIWHRYLPVDGFWAVKEEFSFESKLADLLSKFREWIQTGIYETNVARATLEFQLRMLRNAHIVKMGHSGHFEAVRPFKFHSETVMEIWRDQIARRLFRGERKHLKWKFLIIDDFADEGISAGDGKIDITKKQLVLKLLEEAGYPQISSGDFIKVPDSNGEQGMVETCLDTLMKEERFDVLLLDYLLGNSGGERQYGYEVLLKLVEDSQTEKPDFFSGPFMRHWVFPISSFPFAMYDKLRQLGIDHYHKLWHLSGGGDPITTPNLFTYNLMHFLSLQVKEVFLDDEMLAAYISNYNQIDKLDDWAKIVGKKMENLEAKILLLEQEQHNSIFKESLLHTIDLVQYDTFIIGVVKVLDLLREVYERKAGPSTKFDGEWKALKFKAESFQKSFRLLESKIWSPLAVLQQEIEKEQKEDQTRGRYADRYLMKCPNFQGMTRLRTLDLSNNFLEDLNETLSACPNLNRLDISNNQFRRIPDVVHGLSKLDQLNLSGNEINYIKDSELEAKDKDQVAKLLKWQKELKRRADEILQVYLMDSALDGAISAFEYIIEKGSNSPEFKHKLFLIKEKLKEVRLGNVPGVTLERIDKETKAAIYDLLCEYTGETLEPKFSD
ncbi:MAG: hypothetical protein GVY26_07445, partial [Bacteroidetes bacterium]|nr:hypothetical protein [Bacteroidota bacterium]